MLDSQANVKSNYFKYHMANKIVSNPESLVPVG